MAKVKTRRLKACRCRASEAPELKRIFWAVIATNPLANGKMQYTVRCEYCDATWRTTAKYAAKLPRVRA
jgi:hypothetical protein